MRQEVREKVEEREQKAEEGLRGSDRIFVAVHGIGDQFQFETIQLVANRLGKYLSMMPAPIPLGSFH